MVEPAVDVRGISFAYKRGEPVIQDLSLSVSGGTVFALLGANGSGKSTVLGIMSGVLHPEKGRVEVLGAGIGKMCRRAVAKRIAVVPQKELEINQFTVRELVGFGRYPWQTGIIGETPADREKIDRALTETGLTEMAERPAAALSGGERRRVQVAMALVQDTPVLLLDEPTTFLDLKHQISLMELVAGAQRRTGRTVVMVLHDLNLAAVHADRMALLSRGVLLAEGAPADVLTPANIRTAYGVDAAVTIGANRRPQVIPRRAGRVCRRPPVGPWVHLIGGGGAAANLLAELAGLGFHVTLGVANQGDLDAEAAEEWDVEAFLVPPFSPVSEEAAAACREQLASVAAVVVANVPIGPGNLANLKLAAALRSAGVPVLLVNEDPIDARDFTGGEATRLFAGLKAAGAEEFAYGRMAVDRINELTGYDPDL